MKRPFKPKILIESIMNAVMKKRFANQIEATGKQWKPNEQFEVKP